MRAALRRIVAIALLPVVMGLSVTAAKRSHDNRNAMLKEIAAAYKVERNAHNNYLVYASAPTRRVLDSLIHLAVRAESAIPTAP